MGFHDDKIEIDKQFISLFDALTFVAEINNCTNKEALTWLKVKGIISRQIFIVKKYNLSLILAATIVKDDYFDQVSDDIDFDYEVERIAIDFMEHLVARTENPVMDDTSVYGFSRKRFYSLLIEYGCHIDDEIYNYAISFLPQDGNYHASDSFVKSLLEQNKELEFKLQKASLGEKPSRKLPNDELHSKAKTSVSQIIALLATLPATLDLTEPYKAAGILEYHAAEAGIVCPSQNTLVTWFRSAIQSRPQIDLK